MITYEFLNVTNQMQLVCRISVTLRKILCLSWISVYIPASNIRGVFYLGT